MKKITLALLITTALVSSSAVADAAAKNNAITAAPVSSNNITSNITITPTNGPGVYGGFQTFILINSAEVGYMFNKTWGIEAGAASISNLPSQIGQALGCSLVGANNCSIPKNGEIYYLTSKGVIHLGSSPWSLYGKLGIGQEYNVFVRDDPYHRQGSPVFYGGAGIAVSTHTHWTFNLLNLNVITAGSSSTTAGYPSIGIDFHF